MTGDTAETSLEQAGIILNKNVIPQDETHSGKVSGIRIGTAAMATRGMGVSEMPLVGDLLDRVIRNSNGPETLAAVKANVSELCNRFPVYGNHDGGDAWH
jgi:glycine hydroxymethyltransferase